MLDRGPLSDAQVVATLRKFVCVRPLTYESSAEADYLRKIFAPRGFLENTVFAIMDPQAKTYLARPGRGADTLYGDPDDSSFSLHKSLGKVAEPYKLTESISAFPSSGDTRYGLNVAACDYRPLALVMGTPLERASLKERVAKLAWSDPFCGRYTYAESEVSGVKQISGAPAEAGVIFVQPDEYGIKGTVLASVDAESTPEALERSMAQGLEKFVPRTLGDHMQHLRNGVKLGIRWKPVIPCEDQQGNQATQRLWGDNEK